MNNSKKALVFFFLAVLISSATAAETITGRAVNYASAPLAGVRVTLSQLKVSDTTTADGIFSLSIASSVLSAERHAIVPSFSIQNNRVGFVLSNQQNVVIALFDASGRKAAEILDKTLTKGKYDFFLSDVGNGLASEMAKRAVSFAAADTIALSKTGYFISRAPLSTLATQDVGDIILNLDKIAVNNANQDLYDQFIVESIARNGLDSSVAMILKAMIVIESSFNVRAISMYDTQLPCGTHSYGLIQVTPGCIRGYATLPATTAATATITGGLNGVRPVLTYANQADSINGNTIVKENNIVIDLVTNPANALYATSAFNPAYNLDYGAKALAGFIADVKSRYTGCTAVQYVDMGLAAYNRGGNAVSGCGVYTTDAQTYVNNVVSRYRTFCTAAGITPVY